MSANYAIQTREQCKDEALAKGLECFFAEPDELFLDFDVPNIADRLLLVDQITSALSTHHEITVLSTLITTSQSGNKHVYIKLSKTLNYFHAICLQAAMGSDPIREVISVFRDYSALFETESEVPRVEKWRRSVAAASPEL